MANSFNTDQTSITTASSDTTVFTASASTTLIKSVRVVHASGTSSATLSITKSGSSTRTDMNTVALSQNVLTDLISDVLPLESGDVIKVRTSHQPSEVFVSYVENTTSVSGQSIDVLTDVDITTTAPTNGQTLVWNNTAGEFQPGDAGGSTATLDDIGNVDTTGKQPNDVLAWDGSEWVYSRRVSLLYELLKEGTSKTITAESTNADETEGFVKLEATTAKLKVNNTGVEINETSPGDIEFVVATDSSGTTAFTALHIDGTTTANVSDIIVKQGAYFKFDDGLYTQWIKPTSGNTGNTSIVLPSSSGQLALTTQLYTDSDADARIAAASVTDLTDVSSAGSGAIITSAERTKLSGIAASAEVNVIDAVVDDTSPQLGGNLDVNGNEIQSTGDVIVRVDSDNNTALSKFVIKDGAGTSIYTIDEEGTTIATTGASNNIKIGNLDGSLSTFNGISLNNDLTYPGIVGFAGGSSTSDNFFLFGEVVDIRAGGASDASMRIAETGGETTVVINHAFPVPTTHTLYVDGNANFTDNVDVGAGLDVTGNITVTGTVDGVDIASSHASYEEDQLVSGQNVTMNTGVSVASNKIVDIMGDALADTSNANTKKFLGFHTGSGVCVLKGMVDANNSISGATAGSPLWLGASGSFSATAPTTATYYSRVVGYYIGTLIGGEVMCYFDPSKDWVQID